MARARKMFETLDQSYAAIEHDVFTYFEKLRHENVISIDAKSEAKYLLERLEEGGFLDSHSPEDIVVPQAQGQEPHIAFVWKALGYACAARLLIDAGKRDFAWRALLDVKENLLQARIADHQFFYYLDLSHSRERANEVRKASGTKMRDFVANAVRTAAGDKKWRSAKQAAQAVAKDVIAYCAEVPGVFRTDDPTDTLEKWMKQDPIVSQAFWETCEAKVKTDFDNRRRRKRNWDL